MRFTSIWGKSKNRPLPSEKIIDSEPISRFLISKRWFAKTTGRVKFAAYLPNKNGETSVYRFFGIKNEKEIWNIGEKHVREPREKKGGSCTIHGRSQVNSNVILENNLSILPQPLPHPRHADINNWPEDKPQRQMKATELANSSTLSTIN